MSPTKKIVFYAILAVIMLAIPVLAVFGYYGSYWAYRKLTFSYDYCGSYGQFDDVLGWKLKENTSSCLALRDRLRGKVYFDSKIYTNEYGFRDEQTHRKVPGHAIVAIGDSWTFGYGVDYNQTYPYFLSKLTDMPVVNMGVPAYGSGNTLLLFTRYVEKLKPKVVVHLTHGLWTRSICGSSQKENYQDTLLPCYWWDEKEQRVQLALPRPGAVQNAVANHRYPGGSLTAGYDSFWRYLFFVKPREFLGIIRDKIDNQSTKAGNDNVSAQHLNDIFKMELSSYIDLAKRHGFTFVLVDPGDYYRKPLEELNGTWEGTLVYVGKEEWQRHVVVPEQSLPPGKARVPGDGHYGEGTNMLIAKLVKQVMDEHKALK